MNALALAPTTPLKASPPGSAGAPPSSSEPTAQGGFAKALQQAREPGPRGSGEPGGPQGDSDQAPATNEDAAEPASSVDAHDADAEGGAASTANLPVDPMAVAAWAGVRAKDSEAGAAAPGSRAALPPDDAATAAGDTLSALPDDGAGTASAPEPLLPGARTPLAAMPERAPQIAFEATLAAGAARPAAADLTTGGETRHLSAPMHSPAFAPELGAQLRLMVKEGQNEARLHLNPAEMGPIQVRILIDGSLARVDLTAEQAPTRQALEQAMPVLAGALRESGLTLTGGGVFEQARDGRQPAGQPKAGQPPQGLAGEAGADDEALAGDPLRGHRQARGVLDLYA